MNKNNHATGKIININIKFIDKIINEFIGKNINKFIGKIINKITSTKESNKSTNNVRKFINSIKK